MNSSHLQDQFQYCLKISDSFNHLLNVLFRKYCVGNLTVHEACMHTVHGAVHSKHKSDRIKVNRKTNLLKEQYSHWQTTLSEPEWNMTAAFTHKMKMDVEKCSKSNKQTKRVSLDSVSVFVCLALSVICARLGIVTMEAQMNTHSHYTIAHMAYNVFF